MYSASCEHFYFLKGRCNVQNVFDGFHLKSNVLICAASAFHCDNNENGLKHVFVCKVGTRKFSLFFGVSTHASTHCCSSYWSRVRTCHFVSRGAIPRNNFLMQLSQYTSSSLVSTLTYSFVFSQNHRFAGNRGTRLDVQNDRCVLGARLVLVPLFSREHFCACTYDQTEISNWDLTSATVPVSLGWEFYCSHKAKTTVVVLFVSTNTDQKLLQPHNCLSCLTWTPLAPISILSPQKVQT